MDRFESAITERLIPQPAKISLTDGAEFSLCNGCKIEIGVAEMGAIPDRVMGFCQQFWKLVPELSVHEDENWQARGVDEYQLKITDSKLQISARGLTGVQNAFKTLRQLAEPVRGTAKVAGYLLPQCQIDDTPAVTFRGMHLCFFPETPLCDIEKRIRLAAYHKFNYIVLEIWGIFPFESHPEFGWAGRRLDRAELKRLIHLGQELGITLLSGYNILGHASGSREKTGKHAILDLHRELEPLFEPFGWCFCLTNPETRRILTDLVTELYDFFECPGFFYIGCDEAYELGTCSECRKHTLKDLMRDHLFYFHDLFQKRNARMIMSKSMLIAADDPRWKDYYVFATSDYGLDQLYKELPRDIIILDPQYGSPTKNEEKPETAWPIARLFRDEHFDVLIMPWLNRDGMKNYIEFAQREGLFGVLQSTWHRSYYDDFYVLFGEVPSVIWNPERRCRKFTINTAAHLRQIQWDMNLTEYEKLGYAKYQISPGEFPFVDF